MSGVRRTAGVNSKLVPSLKEFAEDAVYSSLGGLAESAECHFSCGGSTPEVNSVLLFYKQKSGDWCSKPLALPEDLSDEFLSSCSLGSCGVRREVGHHGALQLEVGRFCADFELANTCILGDITRIMCSSIRAELSMLNVYSTGACFKSQVSSPNFFGSLVVCLPSQFTGGGLVTRYQGRQFKFDWSSSATTHWAAFLGDVEHEFLPVTSGHCVILAYKLYCDGDHMSSLDTTTNPLYQELLFSLRHPHFMRKGGTLGFWCQHKYPGISTSNFAPLLKGQDLIIYKIAVALRLKIFLEPIISEGPGKLLQSKPLLTSLCKSFFMPEFQSHTVGGTFYDGDSRAQSSIRRSFDGVKSTGVRWCQRPKFFEPILSGATLEEPDIYSRYYEAIPHAFYQSAACLIQVPKYTNKRGVLPATRPRRSCPPAKRRKTAAASVTE